MPRSILPHHRFITAGGMFGNCSWTYGDIISRARVVGPTSPTSTPSVPIPAGGRDHAFLASYSADLVALVAALLALAGLDDDRGSGSKVDFANTVDKLADRVRLIAPAGRLMAPAKTPKILAILDRYVREVNLDETVASWHPKAGLAKQIADDGKNVQWRLRWQRVQI